LTKQYEALFSTEGITVTFDEEAIDEIAQTAFDVNAEIENIGARRLQTVVSKLLNEFLFDVPDKIKPPAEIVVTRDMVKQKLSGLIKNKDLSEYIL
jgi:ATP-dependent HslUV protease ATP-binding subunit HslU